MTLTESTAFTHLYATIRAVLTFRHQYKRPRAAGYTRGWDPTAVETRSAMSSESMTSPQPTTTDRAAAAQQTPPVDLAFESHGLKIGIRFGTASDLAGRTDFLPPGARIISASRFDRVIDVIYREADPADSSQAGYQLAIDGEAPAWPSAYATSEILAQALERDIEHYVAEFSVDHLFVHAGVVVWSGRAIVIPGRSHAGKSTLVRGLVHAGATYYSDEYAVLDRNGNVYPYQRRLSQREGPYGPAGRIDLAGEEPADLPPMPVGLVALLKFSEDDGWSVETLTGASAIMAICDHTVAIRRRPADTFAILGAVEHQARIISGTRGEASDTIDRLRALLDV